MPRLSPRVNVCILQCEEKRKEKKRKDQQICSRVLMCVKFIFAWFSSCLNVRHSVSAWFRSWNKQIQCRGRNFFSLYFDIRGQSQFHLFNLMTNLLNIVVIACHLSEKVLEKEEISTELTEKDSRPRRILWHNPFERHASIRHRSSARFSGGSVRDPLSTGRHVLPAVVSFSSPWNTSSSTCLVLKTKNSVDALRWTADLSNLPCVVWWCDCECSSDAEWFLPGSSPGPLDECVTHAVEPVMSRLEMNIWTTEGMRSRVWGRSVALCLFSEAEQIASNHYDRNSSASTDTSRVEKNVVGQHLRSSCCWRFAASRRRCSSISLARLFSSSSICRRRLASSSRRSNSILEKPSEMNFAIRERCKSRVLIKHTHAWDRERESQITRQTHTVKMSILYTCIERVQMPLLTHRRSFSPRYHQSPTELCGLISQRKSDGADVHWHCGHVGMAAFRSLRWSPADGRRTELYRSFRTCRYARQDSNRAVSLTRLPTTRRTDDGMVDFDYVASSCLVEASPPSRWTRSKASEMEVDD